jgi:hypothetical protein
MSSNYDLYTNRRRLETFATQYNKNEEELFKSFKDKIHHEELLKSDSAFFNPKDKGIYFGETAKHTPTYSNLVFDTKKYAYYMKKAAETGDETSSWYDKAKHDPFTPEFAADAAKFMELQEDIENGYLTPRKAQMASAGYMTQADFQGLRLVSILGSLVNQEQRMFSLQDAGTKYTSTNVVFRIPTVTRFQIAEGIHELEGGIETMKMAFASTYVQLLKDVAHLAWSDEFQMSEYDQPIMQLHMQNATSEFERVHASKGATQILRLTPNNVAFGWNQLEAGADRSKSNPIFDIAAARVGIYNAFGNMARAASNYLTYQTYLTNSYVRGLVAPQSAIVGPNPQVVSAVPGQPNLAWYLDELLPDGKVAFWDALALADIQGPVRTSTYRDEEIGGQGVFIRNWNGCFFIRLTQGYMLGAVIV